MPKRRAASRWLSPSTWQAWRTLPYSSTENIPRLPARSDRAQGRHQGGTVWHRRGRATQPAVSEGHFLTAAYMSLCSYMLLVQAIVPERYNFEGNTNQFCPQPENTTPSWAWVY